MDNYLHKTQQLNHMQKEVETDKDILTMALTENSTGLIVDEEGNVYTVGYNGQGQLGNGTYESLTSKI